MSSIVVAGDTSGSVTLQAPAVAGSTVLTLPSVSGTLSTLTTPRFTTTIGVGNATPSASGSGISFPATQSASTDANTLDDYEEGTWTPTISFNGVNSSGAVYGVRTGQYTKIGTMVQAQCICVWTNKGSGTGNFSIDGFPFSTTYYNSASFSTTGVSYTGGLFAQTSPGSVQCYFYYQTETGTKSGITNTAIGTSGEVILTMVYTTT